MVITDLDVLRREYYFFESCSHNSHVTDIWLAVLTALRADVFGKVRFARFI